MKKSLIILSIILITCGLQAQTNVATQHRSTESIRLKDMTVTDIVTEVNGNSTDEELPTAQAVFNALGGNIGIEFEYFDNNNLSPGAGYGYFENDSIIIHLTDLRGIDVNDAIDGASSINVRSDNNYINYLIDEIIWNETGQYYFIKLNLGKGAQPEPISSNKRWLTFEKGNINSPPNDSIPDANMLGFEFQYNTSTGKPPTDGTIYISNDTIELWKSDRRDILISNVIPTASHIRIRNDSVMIAYEILSIDLIGNDYYRLIINIGKGTPDEPQAEEVTFVSFVFTTGTGTGLEKISEGGNSGWRLIGVDPENYGDIGSNAVDLSHSSTISASRGATGDYSFAGGNKNTVAGDGSAGFGYSNSVSGMYSIVVGNANWIGGDKSFSFGQGNVVFGDYSFSGGLNTEATGNNSFVMGSGLASNEKLVSAGDHSFTFQVSNEIGEGKVNNGNYAAILGGMNNKINSSAEGAVILGGNFISATQPYTTYMEHANLKPQNSAPTAPEKGSIYASNTSPGLYYFDGENWIDLTASASGISNINDAGDMNTSGITDWSVPKWSLSTGKWIMDIDSTSTGLSSDYKIKLNSSDASPDYLDNKLTGGDFITLSNNSGIKEVSVNAAGSGDVYNRSNVEKAVTPDLMPVFGSYDPASGSFVEANGVLNTTGSGLLFRYYLIGDEVRLGLQLFTSNLQIKNLGIDFNDYVIISDGIDKTYRMSIGALYELLQASELEMFVMPGRVYNLGNNAGWSNGGSFSQFSFARNISIAEWDGSSVSTNEGTLTFENQINCSATVGLSSGNTTNVVITVDAGTYLNDGTIYGSVDVVFTHSTSGFIVRETIKIIHNGEPIH